MFKLHWFELLHVQQIQNNRCDVRVTCSWTFLLYLRGDRKCSYRAYSMSCSYSTYISFSFVLFYELMNRSTNWNLINGVQLLITVSVCAQSSVYFGALILDTSRIPVMNFQRPVLVLDS